MDFGVPNFNGFVFPESNEAPSQVSFVGNDPQSSFLGSDLVYGDSRRSPQTFNFSSSLRPEVAPFLNPGDGMVQTIVSETFTDYGFPYHHPPPPFARSIGYSNESLRGNMCASMSGGREAFTPSQRMELEHQKLIYNYISSNMAVPPNLLITIKNSFYLCGLRGSSSGFSLPNPRGRGNVRQGYGGSSTDPEPGRCRRTDGKRWRCSRIAIADRKYCERHINRGRSRRQLGSQRARDTSGSSNTTMAPVTSSVPSPVISGSIVNLQQDLRGVENKQHC